MSRNVVKSEIDVIEIEDDDQTEVKQEYAQTSQNIAFESAQPEFEQNHDPLVIDQIYLEAMLDPTDHPALTDCQPTLSSIINRLFGIDEESTKEQEVAPNGDVGHLTSINLYPGTVSNATMENNCGINTTEHFHVTSEELHVSDLSSAIMTSNQASNNGNARLSQQNEVHTAVDQNASGIITAKAISMLISTEIPPMRRAKVPNKLIGSKVSKPSIVLQEPVLDDEMPFKLRMSDRKQINYCDSKSRVGSKIEEKRLMRGNCSYSTKDSHNLLTHGRIHTCEKPFKCTQCSYASAHLASLKAHMRTHTGEKPYKCSQCLYASAQLGNLTTHMRTHTDEKPYKCSQCSYTCAQAIDLVRHMSTHTGEKPYKCTECTFASAKANHLKMHIRTHTGEKPYKCSQCSYASAKPDGLKKHYRTHTGEKPYKCCQCSYASANASTLNKHMCTHTGEKPYTVFPPI